MRESGIRRVSRELFLAAFGMPVAELDARSLDCFTQALEEHFVRGGDVLYGPEQGFEFLYFMQEGRVRVSREEITLWTFQGRWLVGTFELLGKGSLRRTATALQDFGALRIPKAAFLALMADSFLLTRGAIHNAATTVARLEERAPVLARPEAPKLPAPARPLESLERLVFLKRVDAFDGAGMQALVELADASSEVRLGSDEGFDLEDPDRDQFFFVIDGQVAVTTNAELAVRAYGPGDLVAGAAALARTCKGWKARATTATRLLAVPIDAWYDQVEDHFDLARATLATLAARGNILLESLATREGPEGLTLT